MKENELTGFISARCCRFAGGGGQPIVLVHNRVHYVFLENKGCIVQLRRFVRLTPSLRIFTLFLQRAEKEQNPWIFSKSKGRRNGGDGMVLDSDLLTGVETVGCSLF
ncbi:MAG: hypothetical protein P8185_10825 [Deltaproteobacteria bacterium]|jgi:hypothetical protein